MKKIFILICMIMFFRQIHAQTIVEKHLSFSQKNSVVLNIQIADSIRIIPWNQNEVYVWASVNINNNKDNDKYLWTFNESGTRIEIGAKYADKQFWSRSSDNCCCCESEIYCEVHIPENADISVESISGNLIISGKTSNVKAKTISGFIDMTVSPDRKADLEFKTITGTVYTNIDMNPGNEHKSGISNFTGSINGGGNPISLETISGDIYLRK